MALDMKKMRQKLNHAEGKSTSKWWKPQDGEQVIRILPTSDGDPFKQFWLHYNLVGQTGGVLCPKRNFGDDNPVLNFATKLYKEGTPESIKMAKDLFPKQRFFSPVIVRGEEDQGVRIWGYSKTVYKELLKLVFNPDYGDITDTETGTDLVLTYGKAQGMMFPQTSLTPKRKDSPLCTDGDEQCKELLEQIPDFSTLHERKTTAEMKSILERHIAGDAGPDQTEKYGATSSDSKEQSPLDKAFSEILGDG